MGVASIFIGATGSTLAPTGQAAIGAWLQERLSPLVAWLEPIPEAVMGATLVAIAIGAVAISGRRRKPPENTPSSDGRCHEQHGDTPSEPLAGDVEERT